MAEDLAEAFGRWVDGEERRWAVAVTNAVHTAATLGRDALRGQLDGAFPGTQAARLVTAELYPDPAKNKVSLGAAASVGPRGAKAAEIVAAWSEGTTIRSADGFWLAIPTDAVPRDGQRRRLSPGDLEQRMGIRLRLVPAGGPRGSALLVADDLVAARSGIGWRQATKGRQAQGRSAKPVVFYVLVPEVTLTRRLDPKAAVESGFSRVIALLDAAVKAGG